MFAYVQTSLANGTSILPAVQIMDEMEVMELKIVMLSHVDGYD